MQLPSHSLVAILRVEASCQRGGAGARMGLIDLAQVSALSIHTQNKQKIDMDWRVDR